MLRRLLNEIEHTRALIAAVFFLCVSAWSIAAFAQACNDCNRPLPSGTTESEQHPDAESRWNTHESQSSENGNSDHWTIIEPDARQQAETTGGSAVDTPTATSGVTNCSSGISSSCGGPQGLDLAMLSRIRSRLRDLGFLAQLDDSDQGLGEAVRRFQASVKLRETGTLDRDTLGRILFP